MHELLIIILVVNLNNMQMATVWDKNVKDAHICDTKLHLRGSKCKKCIDGSVRFCLIFVEYYIIAKKDILRIEQYGEIERVTTL